MKLFESDILNGSILIVDDQEANVSLLEQMLREAGYTSVSSTMNPQEVCTLHRKNHYDLILLDLQMPGMSGIEAMKILRADPATAHIPVIALSANAVPHDIARSLEAGFFNYLTKPIKVDLFTEALDAALKFSLTSSAPTAVKEQA